VRLCSCLVRCQIETWLMTRLCDRRCKVPFGFPPITQSRQHGAQTTSAHLYWCGADPSGPWPAPVAGHGGHCPERIHIFVILAGSSTKDVSTSAVLVSSGHQHSAAMASFTLLFPFATPLLFLLLPVFLSGAQTRRYASTCRYTMTRCSLKPSPPRAHT